MYLEKLKLDNFRSFADSEIRFCRGLTLLVGENNGGKSNAIDALRLLTSPLGGRRELYCETADVRLGSTERKFELTATFTDLSPAEQGRMISAATDSMISRCVFGLEYDETTGRFPIRPTLWSGQQRGNPEPGSHEMIRHVYLQPLRDAKRSLASGNPTRIYALLNHFLEGADPEDLARSLQRQTESDVLAKIGGAIEVGLSALTSGVRRQVASLGFAHDEKLIEIARDLRFNLADHGIEPEDLRYSGHGYANLLYMAAIAVELEKVNDADLTLFLVEEPEAHLHPQLQAAVLSFLNDQADKSRNHRECDYGPTGELQVIVATHSPNLSAWVDNEKLVFFRSFSPVAAEPVPGDSTAKPPSLAGVVADGMLEIEPASAAPVALPRRLTKCIPLSELDLDPSERRKIDRYLDVTKSAFLFGGRVLLVEGIAETLLLPVIAKKIIFEEDAERLRLFRSAVFVPIDGVDFQPYVKLLLSPVNEVRIADRVVVVTDGDSGDLPEDAAKPGVARKSSLMTLAATLGANDLLEVFVNDYSLETELVRAGNAQILKEVFLKLHPRSSEKWEEAIEKEDAAQAKAIQNLFQNTRKGDFAQLIAEEISNGAEFTVPSYLKAAIEALVR